MTDEPIPGLLRYVGDQLGQALILVDADGRIMFANEIASELIALGSWIVVNEGVLIAHDDRVRRALVHRADTRGTDVALPDGLTIAVTPLSGDDRDTFDRLRNARVVRIAGPAVVSMARRRALRSRFDATGSEAQVADLVADGQSVSAIATRLGIAPSTVRSHLKHLFIKTGAHNQRQLARIVRDSIVAA